MEGSPASNAIFSVLLDDMTDHLPNGVKAFVYCDNIILVAPTVSLAQRAKDALVQYLSGHRAGPFDIRSEVLSTRMYFDHLGYSFHVAGYKRKVVGLSLASNNKLGARIEGPDFDFWSNQKWLLSCYKHLSPGEMSASIQRLYDEAIVRAAERGESFTEALYSG